MPSSRQWPHLYSAISHCIYSRGYVRKFKVIKLPSENNNPYINCSFTYTNICCDVLTISCTTWNRRVTLQTTWPTVSLRWTYTHVIFLPYISRIRIRRSAAICNEAGLQRVRNFPVLTFSLTCFVDTHMPDAVSCEYHVAAMRT